MSRLLERFLDYVRIDTQSDEAFAGVKYPSTEKQYHLAKKLTEDLRAIGLSEEQICFDEENCYVYATVPASPGYGDVPKIGFIAHMDTSTEVSDTDVRPRLIEEYDGGDIVLSEAEGVYLKRAEFPELGKYVGKSLVVTDGRTLLGADDKAGVAEIVTMAEYFLTHPEAPHGTIQIGFTPDEEVGCGADRFDVAHFGADFAYTVDGGALGELEYENFNAADARLTITGRSVHPGSAKNKMVNAILLGLEFHALLPVEQNPMYTENYEGFYHLERFDGGVEVTKLHYIIRDHDRDRFEQKKALFLRSVAFLNEKYGREYCKAAVKDSYYNMSEQIKPHFHLIDNAKLAMERAGVHARIVPVRGGTDGARLSYMGLPCPNLCTGGENFHGRQEYACVQDMETVVEILKNIVTIYAQKGKESVPTNGD